MSGTTPEPRADGARIDAHLHLWRLGDGAYSWLSPALGPLYRDFEADEAERELRAAGVSSAILVQADDALADTRHMLAVAEERPWVAGVVGWVRLDDPHAAAEQLTAWSGHPRFRGVRHLVHDDPRADFLDLDPVRASLRMLAEQGYAFDVPNAWPRHLDQATALADAVPDLPVVLDHLAKPPRGGPDLDAWRRSLLSAARRPNVVAKVSGLRVPGAPYTVGALRDIWETALDAFGPDRLMWGSDWPMNVPDGGYGPTVSVLDSLIAELAPAERAAIEAGTARRVYRLPR